MARWLSIIIRRWRSCVEYNKASMAALIHTIKQQAGPLRTSLLHKRTYRDVWTIIHRKVLCGRGAIRNLFNTTGPSHQVSLKVGKCLDSMDTFLMVATLAIRLGLHQYLEPDDTPTIGTSRNSILY